MNLQNKVAVVTGGASGLGLATVQAYLAKGAKVAIWDLNAEQGAIVAAELGSNALFCRVNVSDEASVQAAILDTVAKFGGIHITVNCAGIGSAIRTVGKNGPMPLDIFSKVIGVNLIGTFNVTRLTAAEMAKNIADDEDGERGVIINTASVAAFDGQIGQSAYAASKGAVVAMTLPLARELAREAIRVMTIAPGIMETPMLKAMPQNVQDALGQMVPFPPRLAKPEEFAHLVGHIFENSYLNGEVIRLDGAIRMQPK